ncbi:paralemmin-1-like isoform X2 [Thunnus maccoyii]|nr:paralemmin-1-like isoform X2 [Thunnus maccoyii]
MDEAEKYQQRLQGIAERRRQQEEEEKLRRKTDEERLKTAQKKRMSFRDQWLSEAAPAPVLPSLISFRPCTPLQDEEDEYTAAEQTIIETMPEYGDEEVADDEKEEQDSQEESEKSGDFTAAARTYNYQAGADEDIQVKEEAEDHFSLHMAQNIFHDSGHDGRSVLGMLAVQVERDPKTGASVVRSVAPVSSPADAPMAATVFDDGRKSIHAIGGSGGKPSTEELGQILSVIDGVGMKVILDEVTVTPNKAGTNMEDIEADRAPEGKIMSFSTHHAVSDESSTQLDSSGSHDFEAELGIEDCAVRAGKEEKKEDACMMVFGDMAAVSVGKEDKKEDACMMVFGDMAAVSAGKEDKKEDGCLMVVGDMAGKVDKIEDQRLEEGPVTLVFLGYTDDTTSESVCLGQEEHEGMLTAERVIITEEGEELAIEPQATQATLDNVADQEERKESKEEAFQDVPLDGNGAEVKVHGDKGDNGLHNSSPPSIAEVEGTPKRKTCQCCSVM